jgi:1-acyl-sn-glycerol-3-phosphate acyltransferase
VPVQPVALRYTEPGLDWSPSVAWLGPTTLVHSVWAIACARGVQVQVSVLPARATAHADRRALAQRLHDDIAQSLQWSSAAPQSPQSPQAAHAA